MNKENFPTLLKQYRESAELSQEQLADILSQSHRAFSGVNQVMLSQWERGKTKPSFVRRLGIASYFQQSYDFSLEEMAMVKAATKLMNRPINSDLDYGYTITSVEKSSLDQASKEDIAAFSVMHKKLYGYDFKEMIKRLNIEASDTELWCFKSNGLMIGHVIFEKDNYTFLSLGAISAGLRRQMFDLICNELGETKCTFPVLDPAMAQFLYDLHLEPCCNQGGLMYFQSSFAAVLKNPFSQTIQNTHDVYFKYIRYHDQKQKKKSIEYILQKDKAGES